MIANVANYGVADSKGLVFPDGSLDTLVGVNETRVLLNLEEGVPIGVGNFVRSEKGIAVNFTLNDSAEGRQVKEILANQAYVAKSGVQKASISWGDSKQNQKEKTSMKKSLKQKVKKNKKFWKRAVKQANVQLPSWRYIYVDIDGTLFASDEEWHIVYGGNGHIFYTPSLPYLRGLKVTLARLNVLKSFRIERKSA
jgi:hypothetical protein